MVRRTRLDDAALRLLMTEVYRAAGIATGPGGDGAEVVTRSRGRESWTFVVNHTDLPATVPATGMDLLTGEPVRDSLVTPAGGVRVVHAAPRRPDVLG